MAHSKIPQEFLNTFELGQPHQYFARRHKRALWQSWIGLILLIGGLVCLGWGMWQLSLRLTTYGPANFWVAGIMPFALGCGFILTSLVWFFATRRRSCPDLMIYEYGLAAYQAGEMKLWRWSDFASLTMNLEHRNLFGIALGSRQRYLLVDKQGTRLEITDCTNGVEELMKIVKEKILPLLLERSQRSFSLGHSLRFGKIELQLGQGLRVNTSWYDWGQINRFWVERGYFRLSVSISNGERQYKIPVGDVANLEVLLALVGNHVKLKVDQARSGK